MIFIEVPTGTIATELDHLAMNVEGKTLDYIQGAADALKWLVCGGPPPSGQMPAVVEGSLDIH